MALDVEVQRLQIGDVISVMLPGEEHLSEVQVIRDAERTDTGVRLTLRMAGRDDFTQEWPVGFLISLVRGP